MTNRRYAPRDLRPAGRRLWREVHDKFPELTIGEELLLTEACRSADLCDRLNTAAMKPGSSRATQVELRQQRASLAALIAQLQI